MSIIPQELQGRWLHISTFCAAVALAAYIVFSGVRACKGCQEEQATTEGRCNAQCIEDGYDEGRIETVGTNNSHRVCMCYSMKVISLEQLEEP